MPDLDTSNTLFQLAADMVNHSSQNIFLTGKAGTGKTTFLKYITENCGKQTAVIAPTGVAAINAGGTTIHSFFQLPFSPFIPGNTGQIAVSAPTEITTKHGLLGRIKMNNEKRKVLQTLELLIIDEISMVRCDMLDAIDTILRHFRNRYNEPFGGVQLLMIGDMHQLPPVITDSEWNILSQFYGSQYFFSSKVLQENSPAFISFEKIYRQSDEQFIQLLNQVRNNELDEDAMCLLHNRYKPEFNPAKEDGYIILTTHNYKADAINNTELSKLNTPLYSFKAIMDGDFFEKAFPADELLQLKAGAQVMFIKNDSEKIRRYYNGKIGTVTKIDKENIYVQCKNETETIEVSKDKWENIRYTFDKQSQQLKEDVIGSFSQFPLRLAWAITIHKSQGLTFEKAIIDAGAAFAPGQVYVALSRCTNLEGLILHSRINQYSIKNDERITEFSENKNSLSQLENKLLQAKHDYQQNLLLQLFDFSLMIKTTEELLSLLNENATAFNAESLSWTEKLITNFKTLQEVSQKFHPQLQEFFQQPILPHENSALQNRVKAAGIYFYSELDKQTNFLKQCPAVTDSRILSKQFNETLFEIYSLLAENKFMFEFCKNGFDAPAWHQKKKEFKLPSFTVNAYAGASSYKPTDSPHPALHQQLRKLRDDICAKKNQPIYMVAGSVTLNEMATFLPQNIDELAKISGFGKVKLDAYGNQFIHVIKQYCDQHKLSSLIHEKMPKRQRKEKANRNRIQNWNPLNYTKEGKTVNEIASIRNFALQTIEGHLAYYVSKGEIKIDELVSRKKVVLIEPLIKTFGGNSITPIKQQLGSEVSFGEIRLVMAWKEFQKEKEKILNQHNLYMYHCLQLAKLGAGNVAPNPMVGAVLVYSEKIIGEGYHKKFGDAHAEVNCINSVKQEDKNLIEKSTLYVSLEPCSHFGKTPPCTDLIIKNRIPKVVIGCKDVYKKVDGKGIKKLQDAGLEVITEALEKECTELNKRFFTFHRQHRPYIILKWAESANGKIGSSPLPTPQVEKETRAFISNEFTNRLVHKWRSEEAAILIGTNTALLDDPSLTTRLWHGNNPIRMVIDLNLRLPSTLKIFNKETKTIVFNKLKYEEDGNLIFYKIEEENPLPQILKALYEFQVQTVIVEGGAILLQSFIDEGLWDEARIICNEELIISNGIKSPGLKNAVLQKQENYFSDTISYFLPSS